MNKIQLSYLLDMSDLEATNWLIENNDDYVLVNKEEVESLKAENERLKIEVEENHGLYCELLFSPSDPPDNLEKHNLEQQAKGVKDCRESTGFWDVSNCTQRTYLRDFEKHLINQSKEIK